MRVTNNSGALQGVRTTTGLAWLKPGEARDGLEISRSQAEKAGRLSFLSLEGKPVDDLPTGRGERGDTAEMVEMRKQFDASYRDLLSKAADLEGRLADRERELADREATIADLRAKLAGASEGGTGARTPAEVIAMADDGTPFLSFKAEATKLLGDKTPSKKDEILVALKAL